MWPTATVEMILHWLMASLHLIALAVGVAAIFGRARALRDTRDASDLPAVFSADNLWGAAALLWLVTGVWRAFGGLEKGASYYVGHSLFHAKLGLFLVVFLLELWPMVTLMKWRMLVKRGTPVDLSKAGPFARISYVQLAIVLAIVFLATAVARGIRF